MSQKRCSTGRVPLTSTSWIPVAAIEQFQSLLTVHLRPDHTRVPGESTFETHWSHTLRTASTSRTVQGMSGLLEFTKITDARASMREIYDSAERHMAAVVRRENDPPVAVIRSDDLKRALRALCPIDPQVRVAPGGQVSMWIEGMPIAGEGADFEAAGNDLIDSLRAYSVTWVDDLHQFSNHQQRWGLVNLVLLSDDEELRVHLFGES